MQIFCSEEVELPNCVNHREGGDQHSNRKRLRAPTEQQGPSYLYQYLRRHHWLQLATAQEQISHAGQSSQTRPAAQSLRNKLQFQPIPYKRIEKERTAQEKATEHEHLKAATKRFDSMPPSTQERTSFQPRVPVPALRE